MAAATMQAQLAQQMGRLLDNCRRSVEDLSPDELNRLPTERANSIGFDIWHTARTIDNVIFFAFDREQPVWLRDGWDARMQLPKVAQGTGMTDEEAHALRFDPDELVAYVDEVKSAVVPKIEAMSDDYLAEVVTVRPWTDRPRVEHIFQVLIAHGNGHVGRCSLARALLGKDDLGI